MKSRYADKESDSGGEDGDGDRQKAPAHYSRSKKGLGSIMRARRKQHRKDS